MSTAASSVERLESRVLYAIVDADLHRPPTVLCATADLNGDHVPDVVSLEKQKIVHRDLAARSKEDVYVWKVKTRLSDGTGGGLGIADEEVDMVANPLAINVADLDGDGKADIVITDADGAGKASLVIISTDGQGHVAREAGSGLATGRRMHLPMTVNPRATVSADVDGDGVAELAVFGFEPQPIAAAAKKLKPHPNVVVVYGASADGRFPAGPRQTIPLDGIADFTTIASGDLTGDGAADFAITDDSTSSLLIWSPRSNKMSSVKNNPLYKGSGNSGNNPLHQGRLVGTGDLDRDGRLDLVAVAGNRVTISSLSDDGKLVTRTTEGIQNLPPVLARVAVGDVTGDGVPDLVAADNDGVLYVARNTSPGGSKTATVPTFNKGYRKASGPIRWMAPESLQLADFDGDGKQDVLAEIELPKASSDAGTLETRTEFAILLSRQTAAGDFYFERGDKPTQPQFAAGDLNGDHKADLVIASPEHVVTFDAAGVKEDVYVWKIKTRLGTGDGKFVTSRSGATITLDDDKISCLAIGDFNGDHKADVAVVTAREAGSGLATGRRQYQPIRFTTREAGSGIATGRRQYQPIRLLAGDGTGGLSDAGPGGGPRSSGGGGNVSPLYDAQGLAVADLNGDGIDDLVALGYEIKSPRDASSGQATGKRIAAAWILLGQRFAPFSQVSVTTIGTDDDPTLGGVNTILPTGDLDGDGRADLIVSPRDTASGLPTGKRMAILSPDGKGSFNVKVANNPLYQSSGNSGENPLFEGSHLIAAGDVDGDGRPDLLAATDKGLFLSSFDAKSQTFLPPGPCKSSDTPTNLLSSTLLAADLDGDGKMDLLAFDSADGYSAAFNVSAPGSPSYSWKPHNILPG